MRTSVKKARALTVKMHMAHQEQHNFQLMPDVSHSRVALITTITMVVMAIEAIISMADLSRSIEVALARFASR